MKLEQYCAGIWSELLEKDMTKKNTGMAAA
jgi:hypothetical protein